MITARKLCLQLWVQPRQRSLYVIRSQVVFPTFTCRRKKDHSSRRFLLILGMGALLSAVSAGVTVSAVILYHFGISSPVLPGVVPPLNLTAAYCSLWYARFGQGSSISLPKVMALHRRGSISHTGWSFDWNNPSMNYLYHRTFLCPVPYVHKVGIKGKNQKFPRLRKV